DVRDLDPARQFIDEPQVAEFAVHVRETAVERSWTWATGRRERLEGGDGRLRHAGPAIRVVHAGRDDDDTRRRIGDEAPEEQVGEQEVAEVVHREGELEAVRPRQRSSGPLEPGVADGRSKRDVPSLDLLDQATYGRQGAEIEAQLGRGMVAALARDPLHRLGRRRAISAGDENMPATTCEVARAFEADPRVPSGP